MDRIVKPRVLPSFGSRFRDKHKLVGGYVPTRLADLISLYSGYAGKTKSAIILEALEVFAKNLPSEQQILKEICEKELMAWIELHELNSDKKAWESCRLDIRWKEYRRKLRIRLGEYLSPYYVNYVIRHIEQAQSLST